MDLNARILVAEDEIHLRRLISSVLESSGYVVDTVADGGEAWDRLRQDPGFDLIVTDLNMPGVDGFELLRRVRTLPEPQRKPVIVLTAVGQVMEHAKAVELGAGRVMTKPFSSLEMLEAVKERLAASGVA
jgi:CheY-like chemotaxis protein